jgi:hypothetical protein
MVAGFGTAYRWFWSPKSLAFAMLATLLGVSFVMHQVGSSLGAWGGGLIFDLFGSYDHA